MNTENEAETRQPIFNVPGAVMALGGLLVAIYVAGSFVLTEDGLNQVAIWFAYIPYRLLEPDAIPGGMLPMLWTPVTHALLHASWEHVLLNTVWLAIFGTPVARRYGPVGFFALFGIGAVAGAAAFTATAGEQFQVLLGASGGVAGLTGAAMRFIFQPVLVAKHPETDEPVLLGRQLASLSEMMRNPRSRWFTIIWIVLNGIVPFLPGLFGGQGMSIAWQAHLGGFFAGLLLVPLFERKGPVQIQR